MAKKWYDSTIIKIENQSLTTKRFWLKMTDDQPFEFKAGQFITMDLPIGEKRLDRWRSYSIASAPDETGIIELCIVQLEKGKATTYLFEEAKVGTIIRHKRAEGVFTLPTVIEKDLVLVCTGTGVAPFRAMIWDIFKQEKTHQSIHLIFGTRYEEGILYREEFEQLQQQMPSFKYSVALSREENLNTEDYEFDVQKGYVHQLYEKEYAVPNPNTVFYFCGWSQMIDEAVEKLKVLGYETRQVIFERYG